MAELMKLIEQEIPEGRQSLQENFNNLEGVAQYCQENYVTVPGSVRFFGIGGMWVNSIPHQTMSELLQFQPQTVVIQLGGKNISAASSPNQIYQMLMDLTVYLKDNGINNVYVVEIVKLGCFVKSPGLTNDSFNKQRNKINRLLKGSLKDNFINLKVNFPKDYDNQFVHFNQSGLNKQFFAVRRPFFKA